ncbi:MAG TPA: hypothetical protein VHD59_02645 [Pseudolabrys sp.]|jgi:hypothetical protein|nr:hypothetical protein [Pseudolabrys sp.]
MSKSSAKKSSRAAKSAGANVKKSAKLPRALAKKAKPLRHLSVKARLTSSRGKGVEKVIRTPSPPVQPIAVPQQIVLRSHRYHVGDVVYYTSPSFGRAAATGSYTVVKQLPSEGDDYQYRIKNNEEAFERVAKESQLDRA